MCQRSESTTQKKEGIAKETKRDELRREKKKKHFSVPFDNKSPAPPCPDERRGAITRHVPNAIQVFLVSLQRLLLCSSCGLHVRRLPVRLGLLTIRLGLLAISLGLLAVRLGLLAIRLGLLTIGLGLLAIAM